MASRLEDRINELEDANRQLTGRIEEANFKAGQLAKQLDRMQTDMDLRFKELQGPQGGASTAPAQGNSVSMPAPGATQPNGAPVLIPPKGYLQRLRAICDRHDILLIFDEVITGFGRLGAPFAADRFGVTPDLICMAKGLTNAAVPCGAVAASGKIYDAMMEGADAPIELFHGYTYSAHPLACAAGIATLETYKEDDLFARAAGMEAYWQEAMHSLKDARHVIDIRNLGLIGGIELEPRAGAPTARALEVFEAAFDAGLLIRVTADIIALSPPLIIEKSHVDQVVETLRGVLARVD